MTQAEIFLVDLPDGVDRIVKIDPGDDRRGRSAF
jgi:hypothetical protein